MTPTENDKEGTIQDQRYFEKLVKPEGIGYFAKDYSGPIAIDATVINFAMIGVNDRSK